MATNIPPHNPGEIIDATLALIADPDMTLEELMQIVPGPDFPTGGIIIGRSGIRAAFETGRESIIIRARAEIEEIRKRPRRDHHHRNPLPGEQEDAAGAHRRTGAREAGRGHLRDARRERPLRHAHRRSSCKREATPEVVLNQLFRFTQLQISFGINMLALDSGQPRQMGLKDALQCFIRFREEVILRRARFDLARRANGRICWSASPSRSRTSTR